MVFTDTTRASKRCSSQTNSHENINFGRLYLASLPKAVLVSFAVLEWDFLSSFLPEIQCHMNTCRNSRELGRLAICNHRSKMTAGRKHSIQCCNLAYQPSRLHEAFVLRSFKVHHKEQKAISDKAQHAGSKYCTRNLRVLDIRC